MEKRYSLTEILIKEDSLMDSIIESQNCIREAVTQRDWICLERSISKMQEYATDFISLDSEREALGITNFSEEEHLLIRKTFESIEKEKEALREKYQIAEELLNMADTYKEKKDILDKYTKNVL